MVDQPAASGGTRVAIEGPGVNVVREVTDEQAAAILNIILRPAGASRPRGAVSAPSRGATTTDAGSLVEFFRDRAPRRNPDKIMTIVYYITNVEEKASFLPEEILARFKDVGEPPPGNFSRDFRWVKANAWIAQDPKTREFYATASGLAAVETGFSADVTKATKIKPPRRSRRRAAISEPSDA